MAILVVEQMPLVEFISDLKMEAFSAAFMEVALLVLEAVLE